MPYWPFGLYRIFSPATQKGEMRSYDRNYILQAVTVTRVLVWSRRLRLSHWSIALSCTGLMITGWLMNSDPILAGDARDIHYLCSGLLLPALLLRLYLLFFGKGTDHISDCEPDSHKLHQAMEVLRFYLTLGRAPLPRWFSHNPLWSQIYLLLFFFLALSSISGILILLDKVSILGINNNDLHYLTHYVISLFVLLHLPTVFSHDLSNKNDDISGMVNGYKIFHTEKPGHSGNTTSHKVSIDDLMKTNRHST